VYWRSGTRTKLEHKLNFSAPDTCQMVTVAAPAD